MFCMWLLAIEFPYYSQMIGFLKLLLLAILAAAIIGSVVYRTYTKRLNEENMYSLTGLSVPVSYTHLTLPTIYSV